MLPRDLHNLYPEINYRFNKILFQIWKAHDLGRVSKSDNKEAYLVPAFFSTHTRTFHWLGADTPMWGDEIKDKEVIQFHLTKIFESLHAWNTERVSHKDRNVKLALRLRKKVWKHFLSDQPLAEYFQASKRIVLRELADIGKKDGMAKWKTDSREKKDWEELHRAILALYFGYHQNVYGNIEGAFYKLFESPSNREHEYLKGSLGYNDESNPSTFDYLVMEDRTNMPLKESDDQFLIALQSLAQGIFLENILFRTNVTVGGYKPFGNDVRERRQVLLVPVLDLYVFDSNKNLYQGIGGIKTVIIIFFLDSDLNKKTDLREEWMKEKFPLFNQGLQQISSHIAASAQVLATSLPIEAPYDLLRHFIKVLVHIQDWESATIVKSRVIDGVLKRVVEYRFERTKPKEKTKSFKYGWRECSPKKQVVIPRLHESISRPNKKRGSLYGLWWTSGGEADDGGPLQNLWSTNFVTELGLDEKAQFGEISIYFEFPLACRIPDQNSGGGEPLRALRLEILRQQRDLLNALIPKVRARRAALRSAVSAIMGRNMSHNIGSHVIARQISHIKDDLEPSHADSVDHRESFLGYLQRRMDFLAEIATADKAYWEQPLGLGATFDVLNYEKQNALIADAEGNVPDKAKPILLALITGKDGHASVSLGNEEYGKQFFSCPGGEVGAHALYIILENIIRNSARHNDGDGKVELKVHIRDAEAPSECPDIEAAEAKDLIEITVVDKRTPVKNNERKREAGSSHHNESDKSAVSNESKTLSIKHLNDIFTLEGAGFFNADNLLETKYWGLREMQVCANYLRGMALSELESPPTCAFPAIEALAWSDGDKPEEKYLAYRFYLKRARIMAYVTTDSSDSVPLPPNSTRIVVTPMSGNDVEGSTAQDCVWDHVAREARGYSFLWLDDSFKASFENLTRDREDSEDSDRQKLASDKQKRASLPQRVVFGSKAEMQNMIARGASGEEETPVSTPSENPGSSRGSLEWTDLLHCKVMDQYRTNDPDSTLGDLVKSKLWGGGLRPVEVTFFPRAGEAKPAGYDSDNIKLTVTSYSPTAVNEQSGRLNGIQSDSTHPVKIAFLSHPDDSKLWSGSAARGGREFRPACLPVDSQHVANWAFVEPVWSASLHKQAFPIRAERWRLHEVAAAAFARIIVLDERVQAARYHDVRKVTLWKYWPMAGIWVPFHPNDDKQSQSVEIKGGENQKKIASDQMFHDAGLVCNLDQPNMKSIQEFLRAPTNVQHQWPADFLVIHLTILESLNRQARLKKEYASETLSGTLNRLVQGTQAASASIVVVTGRGVPAQARRHNGDLLPARHLPISTLLEHLAVRPSKLGVMRALWAASSPSE